MHVPYFKIPSDWTKLLQLVLLKPFGIGLKVESYLLDILPSIGGGVFAENGRVDNTACALYNRGASEAMGRF